MKLILTKDAVEDLIQFHYKGYGDPNKSVQIVQDLNKVKNYELNRSPFVAVIEKDIWYEGMSYPVKAGISIDDILFIVKDYYEDLGFEVNGVDYKVFQDYYSNWKNDIVFFVNIDNYVRDKGGKQYGT